MILKFKKKDLINCVFLLMAFFPVYMSSLAGLVWPSSIYMYMQVFGLFAICVYNRNWLRFSRNNIYIYFTVLVMLVLILYGCAKYPYLGQIVYCVFLLFFIASLNSGEWQKYILSILMIAGVIYALATFALIFPGVSFYSKHIASLYPNNYGGLVGCYKRGEYAGITGHYSTNATMLANGVIPCVSLCLVRIKNSNKTTRKELNRDLCLLAFLFIALLLSGKRAHFLFSVCAVLVAMYFYTSNEKNRFAKYLLVISAGVFCGLIAYYTVPAINNLFSRFSNLSEGVSVLKRYELWGAAIEAFKEHPILGNGWSSFPNSIGGRVGYFGYTHNVYLELLCEVGIVGFVVFLTFFIINIVQTLRLVTSISFNKSNTSVTVQYLLLFSLIYQIYFLMYCMTGNPLYDVYVYMPYFVSCSTSLYYRKNVKKVRTIE